METEDGTDLKMDPADIQPAATDTQPQPEQAIETPVLSPEEQEALHRQLLRKKTLGVYTTADLTKEKNTASPESKPGQSTDTHQPDISTHPFASLKAHGKTTEEAAPSGHEASEQSTQAAPEEKKTQIREQEQKNEHQEIEEHIQGMIAVNSGSATPKHNVEQKVLARLRSGVSTMKIKDLQGEVAALTNTAFAGAVQDINPQKLGHMQADPIVTGPGADRAYASAQQKKAAANAKFAAQQAEMQRVKKKENP